MKILLVDQSAADRKYYRILLSQAQFMHAKPIPAKPVETKATQAMASAPKPASIEFLEASRGDQALELCRDQSPDCILLDYKLPDMDGLEFLSRLLANSSAASEDSDPSCAVVMLTSVASEQVAVRALRAGAQDYLVKDRVSAESLNLAIEKATQKVSLIRQLRSERDRLTQAFQDQARMLEEKDLLIQEVHHRVKNNLQVIGSLLHLQAESLVEKQTKSGAAEALRDAQHRVAAMAVVHDQLYESGSAEPRPGGSRLLDLERHASLLMANLFLAYGADGQNIARRVKVQRNPDGSPLMLNADQAIPVGLILNELVSNALKHAFPDRGNGSTPNWVEIEAHASLDGTLHLAVRDSGVGMPAEVDTRRSKSLGLKIVHVLTRQLKGSVAVEANSGTTFLIRFPHACHSQKTETGPYSGDSIGGQIISTGPQLRALQHATSELNQRRILSPNQRPNHPVRSYQAGSGR